MIAGARTGRAAGLRRLLAGALAWQPRAFVLPGLDVARAAGLDVAAAGLRVVATPRHAEILLVVGALPAPLRQAAAVVFAQMPRPRLTVALDAGDLAPLPVAATGSLSPAGLARAVEQAQLLLRRRAWSGETQLFEAEGLAPPTEDHGQMDHGDSGQMDHGQMDHGDSGQMDHGQMDHGQMGFMSMVSMTKDLPRSADGLPMEWVQAPLGPFFAGLPSGLDLTIWLDGDTVARAERGPGLTARSLGAALVGDLAGLPARLARVDPLAPVAYRALGMLALRAAGEGAPPAQIIALERERAASHLSWLASFAYLLGYPWMEQRAAQLQHSLARAADVSEMLALRQEIGRFLGRAWRAPLLSRRLGGRATLSPEGSPGLRGPVARAAGVARDARADDPGYLRLGFEPTIALGGDALARLRVRLDEIAQSLELIRAAAAQPDTPAPAAQAYGTATVETPRGAATLALTIEGGQVREARLDPPSAAHLTLIDAVALQQELADALVGIASLDLSPWEVCR